MKKLEFIIVHISDSEFGCAREIRKWHMDPKRPGGPFLDIGYEFIILNGVILPNLIIPCLNGSIELGRYLDGDRVIQENEIGAHALGYNDRSLGICGIGKTGWHPSQEFSLVILIRNLMHIFGIPPENVLGHCETEGGRAQGKTCPNLDMQRIRSELSVAMK